MTPKVDTFEHNIAEEIKRKEEAFAKAALNDQAKEDDITLPKRPPVLLIALVTCFVLALAGLIGLGYFYVTTIAKNNPIPPQVIVDDTQKTPAQLSLLSPTLDTGIGRYVTKVEKRDLGYIITINNYSAVFAFMTRNENAYIEGLASQFYGAATQAKEIPVVQEEKKLDVSTTSSSTPILVATTTQASSTLTSTSTKKVSVKATSTKILSKASTKKQPLTVSTTTSLATDTLIVPEESFDALVVATDTLEEATSTNFKDVTIANQNMRVFVSGTTKVVYAFVGNATVIISNSEENVLALKGAILH
jgi:hypothetical protein